MVKLGTGSVTDLSPTGYLTYTLPSGKADERRLVTVLRYTTPLDVKEFVNIPFGLVPMDATFEHQMYTQKLIAKVGLLGRLLDMEQNSEGYELLPRDNPHKKGVQVWIKELTQEINQEAQGYPYDCIKAL
jgi:hypothetical protein